MVLIKEIIYAGINLFLQHMENDIVYKGKISFINFEKQFATIDYLKGNKQKSVNCRTNSDGLNKKPHQFRMGDVVSFQLRLSDRGDKQAAYNIKYLHNEAVDLLIQKAAIENRFNGYLKKVEDKFFVKEWDSYILFPLQLSPWEKPPVETAENQPISFSLLNLGKPNAIVAELFSHNFTSVYKKALQHFKNEITTEAIVSRITPHAVYVTLFEGEMQGKLASAKEGYKEGDKTEVKITHLTPYKIAIKEVS